MLTYKTLSCTKRALLILPLIFVMACGTNEPTEPVTPPDAPVEPAPPSHPPLAVNDDGYLSIYNLQALGESGTVNSNDAFVPSNAFRAKLVLGFENPEDVEQVKLLGDGPWSREFYESGKLLSGTLGNWDHLFYGNGKTSTSETGMRLQWFGQTYAADLDEMMYLNIDAILTNEGELTGTFNALVNGNKLYGSLLGSNILFQQQGNGGILKQERDCGRLLYERAFSEETELEGNPRVEIIVKYYERCIHTCFVTFRRDEDGEIVREDGEFRVTRLFRPAPLVIPQDTQVVINGDTIAAYDLVNNEQPVTEGEDGDVSISGEIKVFHTRGACENMHVVQYIKNRVFTRSGGTETELVEGPWQQDGTSEVTDTNPGQLDGNTLFDTPGLPSDWSPGANLTNGLGEDDEVCIEWDFETFFVCDGELLGWYTWGFNICFRMTMVDGNLTPVRQTPNKRKPEWHNSDETPESDGKTQIDDNFGD